MTKIGIYSELYGGAGLGGREYIVAILCEALTAEGHKVEFLHHLDELSPEQFADRFGIPRDAVALRKITTRPPLTLHNFFESRKLRRRWNRALNERYDLFINIVHGAPARCYARRGVLMVLFPFFQPFDVWSGHALEGRERSRLWVLLRHLYHRWQWGGLMRSYQLKTSISAYAQLWTKRRWRVDSTVIYPPADSSFAPGQKLNRILSVGRFSGFRIAGLSKRQSEMMQAFLAAERTRLPGWEYHTLGGLGGWPQDAAYFESVQAIAKTSSRADAVANATRPLLHELYSTSKIFWHAAGLGDDENKHPELMEHFGIATVDAMAAGCVPVVIKKGAQPEIVEHGVSGFLWETLDEMIEFSARLAADDDLRGRMSKAAQNRARHFSAQVFIREFNQLIQPVFEA